MHRPDLIVEKLIENSLPNENGCLIWQRATSGSGYGKTWWEGRTYPAHRLMYQALHGELEKELDVCHTCHNKLCINPDHLVAGTRQQNMNQSRPTGRLLKKLTAYDIRLIRGLLASKKPGIAAYRFNGRVGKLFGVSYKTIEYISKGIVAKGVAE